MRIDEIANLFPVLSTNSSELFEKSPLNSVFTFSVHCQSLFSAFTSNILRKKKRKSKFLMVLSLFSPPNTFPCPVIECIRTAQNYSLWSKMNILSFSESSLTITQCILLTCGNVALTMNSDLLEGWWKQNVVVVCTLYSCFLPGLSPTPCYFFFFYQTWSFKMLANTCLVS